MYSELIACFSFFHHADNNWSFQWRDIFLLEPVLLEYIFANLVSKRERISRMFSPPCVPLSALLICKVLAASLFILIYLYTCVFWLLYFHYFLFIIMLRFRVNVLEASCLKDTCILIDFILNYFSKQGCSAYYSGLWRCWRFHHGRKIED